MPAVPDDAQLTLDAARSLVAATLSKARELALQPVTVAVLDPGGHLVFLAREDGSAILRPRIAIAKAFTALALGGSSRQIADVAASRPSFVASLGHLAGEGIIPAAGGVLITARNRTLGAIGVSGDTPDNDEECALSGLAASFEQN